MKVSINLVDGRAYRFGLLGSFRRSFCLPLTGKLGFPLCDRVVAGAASVFPVPGDGTCLVQRQAAVSQPVGNAVALGSLALINPDGVSCAPAIELVLKQPGLGAIRPDAEKQSFAVAEEAVSFLVGFGGFAAGCRKLCHGILLGGDSGGDFGWDSVKSRGTQQDHEDQFPTQKQGLTDSCGWHGM